jgi:LmbE family N-acetylglucosaminyl deacetylase
MSAGEHILAKLAARQRVTERILIVAAHPDDETIGLGAQLCRFDDALLVHITDGAPRDGRDAMAHGFTSLADYATARRRELTAALEAGGAAHLRTVCLGIVDQEAMHHLVSLTERLRDLLERESPHVVITHAYEGGHPDHDAATFAVHAACRLATEQPALLDMALYHRRDGRLVSGEFLPAAAHAQDRGATIALSEDDRQRKQRMMDCFVTQRWLLVQLDTGVERFRTAPDYDFAAAPHPGELHYETLGWGITGLEWRRYAAAALAELGCR